MKVLEEEAITSSHSQNSNTFFSDDRREVWYETSNKLQVKKVLFSPTLLPRGKNHFKKIISKNLCMNSNNQISTIEFLKQKRTLKCITLARMQTLIKINQ